MPPRCISSNQVRNIQPTHRQLRLRPVVAQPRSVRLQSTALPPSAIAAQYASVEPVLSAFTCSAPSGFPCTEIFSSETRACRSGCCNVPFAIAVKDSTPAPASGSALRKASNFYSNRLLPLTCPRICLVPQVVSRAARNRKSHAPPPAPWSGSPAGPRPQHPPQPSGSSRRRPPR